MVYKKYGVIFRKIREQKKLPLSIFTKVGISKPALSKFERGETMMSFENVVCGLQEMGVTLEEYENFLNGYTVGEEETLWEEIECAIFQENTKKLKELYNYTREAGFYFLSLVSKLGFNSLESQEIDEITDYLYEIDIWSLSDLRLFYFAMDNINIRDIIHIIGNFFPKGHDLFNSKKYQNYFVRLCCRAVVHLVRLGYQEESRQLLEQMDIHALVRTMFQQNLKNLTEGYWTFRFKNSAEGKAQMLDSLEIFKKISSFAEYSYYLKRYYQGISEEQVERRA